MSNAIDVLIPVFNAEDTLDEAMGSILDQTIADYRVIAINDGSTDRSGEILATMASEDRRLKVVETPNQGVAKALNHGLSLCTAPLIARFDADDIAYANRLEVQHAYLAAHPECVAVGSDVDHIDAAGRPLFGYPRPGDPGLADPDWAPAREPYLIHPFLMVRREAITAADGYRVLRTSQDSDLYWRLGKQGRLHNLPERLGKYRIHSNSVTGDRITSGRVMAVCSQLAALSAQRQREGRPDIAFPITHGIFAEPDATLAEMVEAFSQQMIPADRVHFNIAVGAKLMELSSYRAYELDLTDCRFIATAGEDGLSRENVAELRWYRSTTAARLLRRGDWRAAKVLAGPAGLPAALARAAAHVTGLKTAAK